MRSIIQRTASVISSTLKLVTLNIYYLGSRVINSGKALHKTSHSLKTKNPHTKISIWQLNVVVEKIFVHIFFYCSGVTKEDIFKKTCRKCGIGNM